MEEHQGEGGQNAKIKYQSSKGHLKSQKGIQGEHHLTHFRGEETFRDVNIAEETTIRLVIKPYLPFRLLIGYQYWVSMATPDGIYPSR